MKKQRDGRITVKHTQLKFYCILVALSIFMATAFILVHYAMPSDGNLGEVGRALAIVGLALTFCAVFVVIFRAVYRRYVVKPVERLSTAAKQVADGDFSVKILPLRKDGKKDEFELLFDDFNVMVAELASTEILKNDFISNVSHELKTPLSIIQNFSTILQSDGLSESERKDYAGKISEATERLAVLVTNILQLSRLENQKIVVNKNSYNLSEQLCRCIIGFEQVWEEKNIEINTEFDQNVEVYSDENLLDIVWNNLLSNALKFTPENGIVDITVGAEDEYAVVSVKDSGCGMTEHDMRHIFDKFYQADTSHATKGNGLGLALVHEIIKLVNGEIVVDSSPDKGSLFTVKIKLK